MRIAFVGLPLAALLLAADGHEIVWAGICRRDAIGIRRLRKVTDVAIVPDLAKVTPDVRALAPDLVVSWFWTKRVPAAFRQAARLGAIGVHPSLLPRHRGPDPYFRALRRGDSESGVTAHVLEDAYDTGAVLGQERLAIDPSWNAWMLAKKLDRPSLRLLRATVRAYAEGRPPSPIAQDDASATDAPAPADEDLEIDWQRSTREVVALVRAASPWPGAYTSLHEETVVLTRVAPARPERALLPGEAVVLGDRGIVCTGDGAVMLLEGRCEEDESPLDALALADLCRPDDSQD